MPCGIAELIAVLVVTAVDVDLWWVWLWKDACLEVGRGAWIVYILCLFEWRYDTIYISTPIMLQFSLCMNLVASFVIDIVHFGLVLRPSCTGVRFLGELRVHKGAANWTVK